MDINSNKENQVYFGENPKGNGVDGISKHISECPSKIDMIYGNSERRILLNGTRKSPLNFDFF